MVAGGPCDRDEESLAGGTGAEGSPGAVWSCARAQDAKERRPARIVRKVLIERYLMRRQQDGAPEMEDCFERVDR